MDSRALDLYARGYAMTREAAVLMVVEEPDVVSTLLDRWHGELVNPADQASAVEWGALGLDLQPQEPSKPLKDEV